MATTSFKSVPEYMAAQPPQVRKVLAQVRAVIKKALPGADEGLAYQMPTYKLGGKAVLYIGGWKEHYSLYPVTRALLATLGAAAGPYEVNDKGTMRFPYKGRVPVTLIARIAKARASEVRAKAAAKRR